MSEIMNKAFEQGQNDKNASARLTVSSNEVDRALVNALDRAIDDLEAGREYSVDEGMDKVREIRARRRETKYTVESQIQCGNECFW